MNDNQITHVLVDAALEVHRYWGGPGLLENVYEESLVEELRIRGLQCQQQRPVAIGYKGKDMRYPLRLDLIVEDRVIVEVKATSEYHSIAESQLLTYLRIMDLRVGLVLNFGERLMKDGIHRVVNGFRG